MRGLAFDESDRYDERLEALARTALASFERCTKLSERFGEDVRAGAQHRAGGCAGRLSSPSLIPLAHGKIARTLDPELRLRKACQLPA